MGKRPTEEDLGISMTAEEQEILSRPTTQVEDDIPQSDDEDESNRVCEKHGQCQHAEHHPALCSADFQQRWRYLSEQDRVGSEPQNVNSLSHYPSGKQSGAYDSQSESWHRQPHVPGFRHFSHFEGQTIRRQVVPTVRNAVGNSHHEPRFASASCDDDEVSISVQFPFRLHERNDVVLRRRLANPEG